MYLRSIAHVVPMLCVSNVMDCIATTFLTLLGFSRGHIRQSTKHFFYERNVLMIDDSKKKKKKKVKRNARLKIDRQDATILNVKIVSIRKW